MTRLATRLLAGAMAALALGACGGGDGGDDCDPIAAALVERIEVTPSSAQVNLADSLQLRARAFSCAGELPEVQAFSWRSESPATVSVGNTGMAKGLQLGGPVRVLAAAQGREGAASITVGSVPVASVRVEPATATVAVGRTSTLTATALDAQGRPLTGRTATWSSASPGVASVVPSTGAITGVTVGGPVAVTATIEGRSGAAQVTVVNVPVATVTVAPLTATVPAGSTTTLTATLRDDAGNVLVGRAVAWTSSDETIATVSPAGVVTGRRPGGPVTITATSEGRSGTSQVTVTLGAPARLVFLREPSNVAAGAFITPSVQLEIQDAGGNRVTTSTAPVTLALGTNPGGAILGGTLTVNAVAGVATFGNLTLNRVGVGYTLAALSPGLTGAVSAPFNVEVGGASRLAFAVQPTSVVAGVAISPAVQVRVEDAQGNLVASAASITMSIGANPGGGALSGTVTVAAVAGVATFSNLRLLRAGTGYTLVAASAGLASATSNAFNVTVGAANRLRFATEPSNVAAGAVISPTVRVDVEDSVGNLVTGSSATVTLTLLNAPTGLPAAVLSGTNPRAASGGIANFDDLSVNRAANGYQLRAAAPGLRPDTSTVFNVTSGTGARLNFVVQPSATAAGAVIAPAVQVELLDAAGNRVTTTGVPVTIALGANPGGAALSGTAAVNTVNGVATFGDLSLNRTGADYTLVASSPPFTTATSAAFDVTPGAAARLAFVQQPSNVVAGAAMVPAVSVEVQDALGNRVTTSSAAVTVALTAPGGATLTGGTTTAVNGLATFSLSVNRTGTYTLTATSGALTSTVSSSFTVTPGAAARLAFVQQPVTVTAGAAMVPAVTVELLDALDNRVTTSSAPVTLALTTPGGATLTGGGPIAAVAGLATFSSLTVDQVGGYTLTASSGLLPTAVSAAFSVTAGAAAQLVFTTQPPASVASGAVVPGPVRVRLRDANGNNVLLSSVQVTLAVQPSGALAGNIALTDANGIATFNSLAVSALAGAGYTLEASSASLASATSTAFSVTAGAATQLAFTVEPGAEVAGVAIAPAVAVEVRDAVGNRVTTSTASVTVAIGTNPGGATLGGTATVNAVAGVATFSTLTLDRAGTGYTLTAASAGLTGATTAAFNVVAGAATQLAFITQPSNVAANAVITPNPVVEIRDAFGNRVTTSSATVTVRLTGGTGLTGTLSVAAVNGVATFINLRVSNTGNNRRLVAESVPVGALTSATSNTFNIN